MSLWFYSASFVVFLITLLRPFHHANGTLFCRVVTPVALKILNLRVTLRHAERLAAAHPCIYIANHQHLIDLFVYGYLLPPKTITIGKKSLRLIPLFGWLYWLSGHILIDRGNHEKAIRSMTEAKQAIKQKGLAVFICPEGTRSRGKGLGPFKKGAFHLAIETGMAIQPIVASSMHRFLNFWKWNPGTLIVEVLEPISTEGYSLEQVDELSARAHRAVKECLSRLDEEIARANG